MTRPTFWKFLFALFSLWAASTLLILPAAADEVNKPAPKCVATNKSLLSKYALPHVLLTVADSTFSNLDLYATRKGLAAGLGYEADPLWRPFIDSRGVYVLSAAGNAGLAYLGWRMRAKHGDRWWDKGIRRTWWLPQTIDAVSHVIGWQQWVAVESGSCMPRKAICR